jgi:hypothetical protein
MKTLLGYPTETIMAMQQGTYVAPTLKPMAGRITPSQYEKNEWSRMAQDAYAHDLNDVGHRFSMAATVNKGESVPLAWFDALQTEYRAWLIGGFNS